MAQQAFPRVGHKFTGDEWRWLFGEEPGIVHDVNGSAFNIVLPTSSDSVQLGSTSQDSIARVAGKGIRIPQNQLEPLEIPPAVGGVRTDLVTCRYDPTWSGSKVRLHRIAGVPGAGRPAYEAGPPGVEDLPLWAVPRAPGQALSQVTPVDLRVRTGPTLTLPQGMTIANLGTNVPLGTRVVLPNGREHVRVLGANGVPTWWTAPTVVPHTPLRRATAPLDGQAVPAVTEFLTSAGTVRCSEDPGIGDMRIDAGGWCTINLASPFPRGLLSFTAQAATGSAHPVILGMASAAMATTTRRPSRSRVTVRFMRHDGTAWAGQTFLLSYVAVGW